MSRHHRPVHELRTAAESGDVARMLPLLHPAVAVVVDPGRTAEPTAAITVDFTRGLVSVVWVTLLSGSSIRATAA